MKTNAQEAPKPLNDKAMNQPVWVTPPKLDKITLNMNLPAAKDGTTKAHEHHVIDTCFSLKEFPYAGVVRVSGKGYRVTLRVYHVDKDDHKVSKEFILVQFSPIMSPTAAFMRVEYNPSKVTPEHYAYFRKFLLDQMDIHFPTVLRKAYVSRVDVCLQVLNVDMEDIFVRSAKKRKSQLCFGTNGKLETVYLGKSCGNQIKVYDKAKEKGKTGKNIRVEATIKNRIPLKELSNLPNPFLAVSISDLSGGNLQGSALVAFNLFKDSCRYRGIKNALKLLPETDRKKYSKIISDSPAAWWTPKEYWGENWNDALDAACLLPDQCMA